MTPIRLFCKQLLPVIRQAEFTSLIPAWNILGAVVYLTEMRIRAHIYKYETDKYLHLRESMNIVCALFLLFIKGITSLPLDQAFERKGYTLKTDQLDHVYKRAAIVALLKAKANSELQNLPKTEKILFDECQNRIRTPVELAKCVKELLHRRESHRAQTVIQAQLDEQPLMSEESWLSGAIKLAMLPNKLQNVTLMPQHLPTLTRPRDLERYKRIQKIKLNQKFRQATKLKYKGETLFRKARKRRAIQSYSTSPRCTTPLNIKSLRQVEKYFEAANECIRYMKALGIDNSNFLSSLFPLTYKDKRPASDSPVEQLKSVVNQADSGFSFLSPKILNLMPNKKEEFNEKMTFLSPNLLSFHEEGLLPLPRLLKLSGSNECDTQEWIDLIMTMTGASRKLDELLKHFQSHMTNLQEDILPKIRDFQRQEKLFKQIKETMSEDQKQQLQKSGYAKMSDKQLELVYNDKGLYPPTEYFAKYKDDDHFLEDMIHSMAELEPSTNLTEAFDTHQRRKRQAEKVEKVPGLLAPFAFSNSLASPSFLGNLVLSPHAFINEVISPRFFGGDIISPRAFIASTLSPFSMVARVISPSAFRIQTLTPQALTAIALTPEAFLAVILSPRALEARFLSPETLSVAILSPSAGMVRILSPASANVFVLSPTILAANMASKGEMNVEILSPSILVADDNIG